MTTGDPSLRERTPRIAAPEDAEAVARLLHAFNTEFGTPTPGVEVLRSRLAQLLASEAMFAVIDGDPPNALALVSLRPNAWSDGPVALLDELYVSPGCRGRGIGSVILSLAREHARGLGAETMEVNVDSPDTDAIRFYAQHGFTGLDPSAGDLEYYGSVRC